MLRAFWGPGTKPFGEAAGDHLLSAARRDPDHRRRRWERRTLEIAARLGDGCNLGSALPVLDHKLEILRAHAARAGRAWTICGSPCWTCRSSGTDPDDVARLVEANRGRTSAKAYAAAHHAGTSSSRSSGTGSSRSAACTPCSSACPDLTGPAQLERFAPVTRAFRGGDQFPR